MNRAVRSRGLGPKHALGFTLLELLVVIAILATLAAMLWPALGQAKDRAKQVNCLANARQLGLGVMMYADDQRDHLPPSADYGIPTSQPDRIWTAKVLPYVEHTGIYSCPGAKDRAFPRNWDERGVGTVGYTTATAYDPASVEGFPTFLKAFMIPHPALSPLFGDTPGGPTADKYRGFTFDPDNGQSNPIDARLGTPLVSERDLVRELSNLPPPALKPLYARHAGRAILILADGHAHAYTAPSILAQERGAALHWRFRPQNRTIIQ